MNKKVWIIEAGKIFPNIDAGSRCIQDLNLGINQLGINCDILFENNVNFIKDIENKFDDTFILSRPGVAARFLNRFPNIENTIYFGHDLHFKRLQEQNHIENRTMAKNVVAIRLIEEMCWKKSKIVIYPNSDETKLVNSYLKKNKAVTIPIYYFSKNNLNIKERKNSIIFVGGEAHAPNKDAVNWFLQEIWPKVNKIEEINFNIIGKWTEETIKKLSTRNVNFLGNLEEAEMLESVMNSVAGIAPLRFGAGVKRKVLQYCHAKIPIVTTQVGMQGINIKAKDQIGFFIENRSENFAKTIDKLIENKKKLSKLGNSNYDFVMTEYSNEVYLQNLQKLFHE